MLNGLISLSASFQPPLHPIPISRFFEETLTLASMNAILVSLVVCVHNIISFFGTDCGEYKVCS